MLGFWSREGNLASLTLSLMKSIAWGPLGEAPAPQPARAVRGSTLCPAFSENEVPREPFRILWGSNWGGGRGGHLECKKPLQSDHLNLQALNIDS